MLLHIEEVCVRFYTFKTLNMFTFLFYLMQ